MSVNKWELEEMFLKLYDWYEDDLKELLYDSEGFAKEIIDFHERLKDSQLHRLQVWQGMTGKYGR